MTKPSAPRKPGRDVLRKRQRDARGKLHVDLGLRIRERRVSMGKTQQEIAEPIGLTFSQISRIESGQPIDAATLVAIADVLECTASDLLPADGNGTKSGPAPLSDEAVSIGKLYDGIGSGGLRKVAIDFVRKLHAYGQDVGG